MEGHWGPTASLRLRDASGSRLRPPSEGPSSPLMGEACEDPCPNWVRVSGSFPDCGLTRDALAQLGGSPRGWAIPNTLTPFTSFTDLSHQGRGGFAAGRSLWVELCNVVRLSTMSKQQKLSLECEAFLSKSSEMLWTLAAPTSHHSLVLVGVSYLDELLRAALHEFLCGSQKSLDELLDNETSGIGSFNLRINIAFACGLIDCELRQELHTLRKIRNKFAHSHAAISLDHESVRNLVKSLITPGLTGQASSDPQNQLSACIQILGFLLSDASSENRHIAPAAKSLQSLILEWRFDWKKRRKP